MNPPFEVSPLARAGYTYSGRVDSKFVWKAAASYSFDFGQRGGGPVGLSATVLADRLKPAARTNSVAYGVGVGIYYTGRDDLNLGSEFTWSRLPLSNRDIVVHPVSFDIVLRYHF